jgi:ATP-dependent RNA helicase DHX57
MWLVDKLVKIVGFPRKAVEAVFREEIAEGREWGESEAIEILGRRMCGWEDGEFSVSATLGRLRSEDQLGGVEERDLRRAEELEALESVFDDRLTRSKENPALVSISIPSMDGSSSDDLTLHFIFPSDPISSPYPSPNFPTVPPSFYLTSTTLPSYIRLHLHSRLLSQFQDPDRPDLRSTLESGDGGVIFALVEYLEAEWEAVVAEPPSVGLVTQYLVPKLPPPKKDNSVARVAGAPKRKNNGPRGGARREPSMQEQEFLKKRTEEWQASPAFSKMLQSRYVLHLCQNRRERS